MREVVTVVIPIFSETPSKSQIHSLESVQSHLGDYPITFIKGENLKPNPVFNEICSDADFVGFDSRYFACESGYTRFLLSGTLYQLFGWSRYLLVCELNTLIQKNELGYWCRQGYDFIQPKPPVGSISKSTFDWRRRVDPLSVLDTLRSASQTTTLESGISLRKVDVFQKLCGRNRRLAARFLAAQPSATNDSLFWEVVPNRWLPDLLVPHEIQRKHFAQYVTFADGANAPNENPFATTGFIGVG